MSQPNTIGELEEYVEPLLQIAKIKERGKISKLIDKAYFQWLDDNKRGMFNDDMCDDEEIQVIEEYISILKSYLK